MNPVSFGSLYKIYHVTGDVHKQKTGQTILGKYCRDNDIFTKTIMHQQPMNADFLGRGEKLLETTFISALDERDHDIDMICCNYKIKHEKMNTARSTLRTWNNKKSDLNPLRTIFGAWH